MNQPALQLGGDESAHQCSTGTDIDSGHRNRRVLAARVLADVEGVNRLQPRNDDHQVDHQGEYRAADKKIGNFHGYATALVDFGAMAPAAVLIFAFSSALFRFGG